MNEKIKSVCTNYEKIVNCEFLEDDYFSKKLIYYYKRCIEKSNVDDDSLKVLSRFDYVINKYIEDYSFSRKLKSTINCEVFVNSGDDIMPMVLKHTISVYDECASDIPTVVTRWI